MARKSRRTRRLRVVNPDCAGIDIGKDRHFVAVDPERSEEPVRSFGAFTRDLEEMAAWLASCGVTKVAMESTSVYWIAVYETLERAGFEVMLVPPRMTKQIGGRKSDVLDCQVDLAADVLRPAAGSGSVRANEVCPLRSYARQMRRLTGDHSRCVLHMQKALTEMNVKLDSVIANIVGLTGQRILRAIIGGERDPERLATLRHRGIKAGRRYDRREPSGDVARGASVRPRTGHAALRLPDPADRPLRGPGDGRDRAPDTAGRSPGRRRAGPCPRHDLRNRVGPLCERRNQRHRQGGHPAPCVAQDDGRRPHRDPHRRSRYRTGDRLGDRPGLLRLPLRPALLLLACARAGNQDQRRQEPPRQVPEGGQPRRARPCAWRPWPRAAARPSSAPSTGPGSPEWTPPLRSRRPPANSPASST